MRTRRLIASVVLGIIGVLCICTTVLAYTYSASITVAETGGTTYDELPVIATLNNDWLASAGYLTASGLDARVLNVSTELPYMLTDSKILFSSDVTGNTSPVFTLTTGNTAASAFDIITGYNGHITTPDESHLELGSQFQIDVSGYINTDAGTNKLILSKRDSFKLYIQAEDTIRAAIMSSTVYEATYPAVVATSGGYDGSDFSTRNIALPGSYSPDSLLLMFVTSDGNPTIALPGTWTQLFQTANGAAVKFGAWYRIADGSEGRSVAVTTTASESCSWTCYRITGYSGVPVAGVPVAPAASANPDPPSLSPAWGSKATLWFAACGYDDGVDTVSSYSASYTNGRNDVSGDAAGAGTGSARRENTTATENPGTFTLSAIEEWVANTVAVAPAFAESKTASAAGINSGTHIIKVTAAANELKIFVDDMGVPKQTTDITGVSVPDISTSSWYFMCGNVMSYADYIKITTAVDAYTEKLKYQPVLMIVGTTLIDEDVGDATQNGTITFGSSRTADSGTVAGLTDDALTQINDYWNGKTVKIVQTTDGLVPQGESKTITDFDAASDTLTFGNLTAVVGLGDVYELWDGSTCMWGSNPTGIAVTVGGIESSSSAGIVVPTEPSPPDYVSDTSSEDMFTESTGASIPLFYPFFKAASDATGFPIQVFWITGVLTISALAGVATVMLIHSMAAAGIVAGAMMGAFCSIHLIDWWILYVYIILVVAFVIYQRVASV
jgi:hypothetical protein